LVSLIRANQKLGRDSLTFSKSKGFYSLSLLKTTALHAASSFFLSSSFLLFLTLGTWSLSRASDVQEAVGPGMVALACNPSYSGGREFVPGQKQKKKETSVRPGLKK
jgi:hypothetical protein